MEGKWPARTHKSEADMQQSTLIVPRTPRHVALFARDRLCPRHGASCCNIALLLRGRQSIRDVGPSMDASRPRETL